MPLTEAQRTGRLAEIYVERKLTEAGWLCGNFNVSIGNACSWDIFAKKGPKTRVLRVKGASSTDVTWNVPEGPLCPFGDFNSGDPCDWTAVVVNVEREPCAYIFPTGKLIKRIHSAKLPTNWKILHLHFRRAMRKVNYPGQYGSDEAFKEWREKWEL